MRGGVYGEPRRHYLALIGDWSFDLPWLGEAIAAGPGEYGLAVRWLALLCWLFWTTLRVAIAGHAVVGALRLLGFDVFRSTYKPLLARSIVDFWNRYEYYFKELLVEFFFYPVFLSQSKRAQRVRMFLAVMAAAGFGNLYFHLVRDFDDYLAPGGMSHLLCRSTYSVFLGIGVFLSMVRAQDRRGRPPRAPGRWDRLRIARAVAGVWLFHGLLRVFTVAPEIGLEPRARFLLGLLGL